MEEDEAPSTESVAGSGKKKNNFFRKKRADNPKSSNDDAAKALDSENTEQPTTEFDVTDAPAAEEATEGSSKTFETANATEESAAKAPPNNDERPQNLEIIIDSEPAATPTPRQQPEEESALPSDDSTKPKESLSSPRMRRTSAANALDAKNLAGSPQKTDLLRPTSAYSMNMPNFSPSRLSTANSAVSMGSTRVMLPKISIREAEQNVQLPGFTQSQDGFLGDSELRKLFPDRLVRIHIAIWNLATQNERQLPQTFEHLLFVDEHKDKNKNILTIGNNEAYDDDPDLDLEDERDELLPDVYVLGLEESASSREVTLRVQDTLGPEYVCYAEESAGALLLAIFIRRDMIWYTSAPEQTTYVSGVQFNPSTKGATAISFNLFGTSFLFINAHFSAHENRFADRVSDFKTICSSIKLPKSKQMVELPKSSKSQSNTQTQTQTQTQFDCTNNFDVVFFFGDLNFRLQKPEMVRRLLKSIEQESSNGNTNGHGLDEGDSGDVDEFTPTVVYSRLLDCDELRRAQLEGVAFCEFRESRITFAPTYKYTLTEENGVKSYKFSTDRTPSYTDRILYKSKRKNSVICKKYNALISDLFLMSDHRPVYAIFDVELQPQSDKSNIPPNLGSFNHDVYANGLRRRQDRLNAKQESSNTSYEKRITVKETRTTVETAKTKQDSNEKQPDDKIPEKKSDKKQTSKACTLM